MSIARSALATSRKALSTVDWYCACAASYAATAARFLARSAPPLKIGCTRPAARLQPVVPVSNSLSILKLSRSTPALSVICGYSAAVATPICALASCSSASLARTSGRWRTSADGTLTRQLARQRQRVDVERGQALVAGQAAGQHGQLVARLRQRLLERRDLRLLLRDQRLLLQQRAAGEGAEPHLRVDHLERLVGVVDDLARGLQLRPQRGLLDRRGDHAGRQAQPRGLDLEALVVDRRAHAFELAAVAADDVQRVRQVEPGLEQVGRWSRPGCPRPGRPRSAGARRSAGR